MKKIIFLYSLFAFSSCNDQPPTKFVKIDSPVQKKYILPNDEFREKVLNGISKQRDKMITDTILNILDHHKISFCDFVKEILRIEDSCDKVMDNKYPNYSSKNNLIKIGEEMATKREKVYLKEIGLTSRQEDFATTVWAFDTNARSLCNLK